MLYALGTIQKSKYKHCKMSYKGFLILHRFLYLHVNRNHNKSILYKANDAIDITKKKIVKRDSLEAHSAAAM